MVTRLGPGTEILTGPPGLGHVRFSCKGVDVAAGVTSGLRIPSRDMSRLRSAWSVDGSGVEALTPVGTLVPIFPGDMPVASAAPMPPQSEVGWNR